MGAVIVLTILATLVCGGGGVHVPITARYVRLA